jgi:hypothetical protein
VERHGHDHVELHLARQSGSQQLPQGSRQRFQSLVFEKVDEFSKGPVVLAKGKRRVKTRQAAAAQPTASIAIERIRVDEWCFAVDTEVFGN